MDTAFMLYPLSTTIMVRQNPFSTGAEQSVLGAAISDDQCWDEIQVVGIKAEDFFHRSHQIIFDTVAHIRKNFGTSDLLLVTHSLTDQEKIETVGGAVYIKSLTEIRATKDFIHSYLVLLQNLRLRRDAYSVGQKISYLAKDDEQDNLLDQIQPLVNSLYFQRDSKGCTLIQQSLDETISFLKNKTSFLRSGYKDLDRIIQGFEKGTLNIVAARPSMGKTAFALNLVRNSILANSCTNPIIFFSIEMSRDEIMLRLISSLTHINHTTLRNREISKQDWDKIASLKKTFTDLPIFFDDSGDLSASAIRLKSRRIVMEYGLASLIIIDYMQLISPPKNGGNRNQEISEISRGLKLLSKELDVPIVALSQLNRNLEERIDKRPKLSDLRDSGALEQDADKVIFLYRDEIYDPNSLEKGICEVIVGKNRHGPIGKVFLNFNGGLCTFTSLSYAK